MDANQPVAQGPAPAAIALRTSRLLSKSDVRRSQVIVSQVYVERHTEELPVRYPLVYRHAWNFAAKLIQRTWKRFMMRIVYKFLLDCLREFEATLNARDLSRIYPEFLESSDPRMTARLRIRMQGESFPPCLVCRIVTEVAPSVDGGRHAPKWIPLCNAGAIVPVDQKALVHMFLEARHTSKAHAGAKKESGSAQLTVAAAEKS
jgi:hypothetical protein